jgi:hypothetical protein
MADAPPLPIDWAGTVHTVLAREGIRPLFVMMPLNAELIARYASSPGKAAVITRRLREIGESTREGFRRRGFECLDLTDACAPDDFYDLIHTNASGDRKIAEAILGRIGSRDGGAGDRPR